MSFTGSLDRLASSSFHTKRSPLRATFPDHPEGQVAQQAKGTEGHQGQFWEAESYAPSPTTNLSLQVKPAEKHCQQICPVSTVLPVQQMLALYRDCVSSIFSGLSSYTAMYTLCLAIYLERQSFFHEWEG